MFWQRKGKPSIQKGSGTGDVNLGRKCLKPALIIGLLLILISGCAPKVRLTVTQPAEVDTTRIRKVAIGSFEVVSVNQVFKVERNGQWQIKNVGLNQEQQQALSNQIRARVVNLLSTTPYFQLVYTDEFRKLENDEALQKLIAAGGYRTSEIDAVINGRIWLDVTRIDSSEIDKVELEFVEGGRENSFNYTLQTLVYWPFKSISGTLALEMKLTRLNPNEIVSVSFDTRKASYKLGGKPASLKEQVAAGFQAAGSTLAGAQTDQKESSAIEESSLVLPNFNQLVADLSESIAAQFARRIAVTQMDVSYPLATGGNPTARLLIEAGAYEKAIEILNNTLNRAREKNPDDIYNLGLCYEATGDFGIALVTYNEATAIDPKNLIYAQGIGRIERLKREKRRVADQLVRRN
ncbi:tetratricopeptide repeat protein [bacterium]|nr:tetratricopeptide repeat protein [bacterium]